MNNLFRCVIGGIVGVGLLSCGGGDGPSGPPTPVLTTLTISFPTATILVGQSATATAAGLDQNGAPIATGAVTWSTGSMAIATVTGSGVVTGAGAGETQVIASAGGKQAQATVTVNPAVVTTVVVTPASATVGAGETQQLVAETFNANGGLLTGRAVTWASSDDTKATVNATGLVTGVAPGQATITATSEGKSGTSLITISSCNSSNALQLTLGQVYTLTAAETGALCLGNSSASEYVLIPFNTTNVAASTAAFQITGANTGPIQGGQQALMQPGARPSGLGMPSLARSFEIEFRERERDDLRSAFATARQIPLARRQPRSREMRPALSRDMPPSLIVGIPADPVVGNTYQINGNISGNTCSSPKQLRGATVIAVFPRTIVLSDNTSPANGWTPAEMTAFGQAFEDTGYPLDVANFGQPSDIDVNGRVVILFTPGVNVLSSAPGFVVGGAFAARDLFPESDCVASNVGEMFYMPVPDPGSTLNGNYTNKASMARGNLAVLVHELQHLINAGRRIYVNDAFDFEEIWLNEGLSHAAEELLYFQASGNAPRTNIDSVRLRSSQAQLDAVNASQVQNLARLSLYMQSPETNSPFAQADDLEVRGATWQLLRYSVDRKGGSDQATWFALVNSRESGQTNFNANLGNIIAWSRDWAVAQFTDDAGLGVAANHTHPSWNFRGTLPVINSGRFPLLTRALMTGAPVDIPFLNGGGAAYVRFRIGANVPARIAATSSGQPVPAAVEFILVRTQ